MIGTIIIVVLFPATPPEECLSQIISSLKCNFLPLLTIEFVRLTVSLIDRPFV